MTDTEPADLKTSLQQHLADKFDGGEDLVFRLGVGMVGGQNWFVVEDQDSCRSHNN